MNSLRPDTQNCMVYITMESEKESRTVAHTLVREKLVACVNILGPSTSVYTWKGEVEEAPEFVLICKTQRALAGAVADRIKALHSYDVPCVVVYDIAAGYAPYLDWIAAETKAK